MTASSSSLERDALLRLDDAALLGRCRVARRVGGGPGGQHRNKTESAVVITCEPAGIHGFADDSRSQSQNRGLALQRLRLNLALEWRNPPPAAWGLPPEPPGRKSSDYPLWVASLLDVLADRGWRIAAAAAFCGLSTGRLVRVLAHDDTLWQTVNRARIAAGMPVLRQ